MTPNPDVTLPQRSVLGSTMAYREAGNPDAPWRMRTPPWRRRSTASRFSSETQAH
jgi:hypothetical protein